MQRMHVEFMTQLKAVAGCDGMEIECDASLSVSQVLEHVLGRFGALEPMLLDDKGIRHGWLMVGVDGVIVTRGEDPEVPPGSTVLLATPISGG
jgi:hypothetical protein